MCWSQIRATPVCWARQKIWTSPNLSILHTRLNRPFKGRGDFDALGAISKTGIKSFYEVGPGWCDSVRLWVPGWQSRCQRPTKDGLLLPKGPWGQARQVSDVAVKVTIGADGMPAHSPILLLTVEDRRPLLLLLLLVQTVWFRLFPPRHLDATGVF